MEETIMVSQKDIKDIMSDAEDWQCAKISAVAGLYIQKHPATHNAKYGLVFDAKDSAKIQNNGYFTIFRPPRLNTEKLNKLVEIVGNALTFDYADKIDKINGNTTQTSKNGTQAKTI
jgi:hypothetical protein